jgi:hypothetical protein
MPEFDAVLNRRVPLAAVLDSAWPILRELLGADVDPGRRPVRFRRRIQGLPVEPPVAVDPAAVELGPGSIDPDIELLDPAGSGPIVLLASISDLWTLVVQTGSTATEIVQGLALALGAAHSGDGVVVDNDLRLLTGDGRDVAGFVAATRLPPADRTPGEASLQYLRGFPQLQGWPPD